TAYFVRNGNPFRNPQNSPHRPSFLITPSLIPSFWLIISRKQRKYSCLHQQSSPKNPLGE
ncbi:hypothetical protein, partial [Alloalcanivorax venustensis]|uniref:hypothetical protein n=1 Tax=Alloalcanivorax venustensis TaxID=172371 RepID=UPI003514A5E4